MDEQLRKTKLNTLIGYLLNKYDLSHHSVNHICFKIKLQDIMYIIQNYKDVLESSNLFLDKYNPIGEICLNTTNFKVSYERDFIFIESKEYESKNNFSMHIELSKCTDIEIDISCETILSFNFNYINAEYNEQLSFRDDK